MSLIPEEHREHLKAELGEKLLNPVKMVMFTQQIECQFCGETRQLATELAALSDKLSVEVYDFVADADKARELGVDKVPALALIGEKDHGVRFYGFPYGYELRTLIDAVIIVSRGATDLREDTKENLKAIKAPVHIQVFVTLTCPYCSVVAATACKFAVENGLIRVDVVDASEFNYLALKYGVMGVPKTVINDKVEFVGAIPENLFLEHVLAAIA